MSLLLGLNNSTGYDTLVVDQPGPAIDVNRNVICYVALKEGASHIMFVDTDMKFGKDTLEKMLALDKPVVGVASRKKKFPLEYTMEIDIPTGWRQMRNDELPERPFSKIDGHPILVGTGIMLIDLEKIKDVPKPWFKLDSYWNDGEPPGYTGEDIYFCRKVWKAGLEVWCDPTIPIKHIGDFEY